MAEFVACDVSVNPALDGAQVATYATAIREGGAEHGRVLGVLGIFFDWEAQSRAVVDGVRLTSEEKGRTRCMILDSRHRVIASTDRSNLFDRYTLRCGDRARGTYEGPDGSLVGFALTPGYETYRGLGWYGVVAQEAHSAVTIEA